MRFTTRWLGALFLCLSALEAGAANSPNIVLITIDSARTDHMGFLGGKAGLTPNLDRLSNESMVFEHAYAQAPGTLVSHSSLLTGTYPQATGMNEIGGALPATAPYLPNVLKNRGYRTAAFVGSIELDPHNGLAQGFDRGFSTYNAGFLPVIPGDKRAPVIQRHGDDVAKQAATWITKNSQALFFLWVHISDPAAPATSYSASILSADAAVGKVITALKDQKLYARTAIFVAASHGEGLGAHGEDTHGIFLYDETIHVPLLLKLPEGQAGAKHVAAKVRLVDVAPTALEIAALPVPPQMLGQSLLRAARSSADQAVYSRATLPQRGFGWSLLESWRAGKYLYVRAPKPELYDLTADPGAIHNLAQSSKATLETMASQLEAFDRRFGEGGKAQSSELSSSEMQKLASLGYVGLQKSSGATAATGTDPKDKISIANNVVEAASVAPSKPDRAIAALQPVVAGDANLYLAQFALGVALAQKGQFAEAARHLHKAIELQSDSAWANFEIGACLVKNGDLKTAVIHLEIAASRLPGFAPARQMLALAKK